MNKALITTLTAMLMSLGVSAQIAPPPPAAGPGHPPRRDWLKGVDTNNDGRVDSAEFDAALNLTFTQLDRNSDGMIDANEMPRPPRPPRPGEIEPGGPPTKIKDDVDRLRDDNGQPRSQDSDGIELKMLPPFFFTSGPDMTAPESRADFIRIAHEVFRKMDKNGDGYITSDEGRPPHPPERPGPGIAPPPPTGQFIAAELRFGDRLVKGQPFSAEAVIEDTRRLFDGSTVVHTSKGAIYRDSAGRTRREQPLELVGGVSIAGSDGKPQMLVFINDFGANTQYFVDVNHKVVHQHEIGDRPFDGPENDGEAKTESLGTKTIEGVTVEGTRISFEIPAGQIGNQKPMEVVTENWFSPELQMMIMSRHTDPIAGEHLFRLTNIKREEQPADLFRVPAGFRVEGTRQPRHEEK